MSPHMIIVVLCFARLTRPVVVARRRTCLWLLNLNVINISLLALVVEDGLDFGEHATRHKQSFKLLVSGRTFSHIMLQWLQIKRMDTEPDFQK